MDLSAQVGHLKSKQLQAQVTLTTCTCFLLQKATTELCLLGLMTAIWSCTFKQACH